MRDGNSFIHSFIHQRTDGSRNNLKLTARTPNNVKRKDGIRGTGRKQFVMWAGAGSCRENT